jgi:catechol 2,3-dioxygenase-like lactoylglutathione lyase family enzyme
MKIKYICPLITVQNIEKSREFYEEVLNQEVEIDHGANVTFKGGFAIHEINHFQGLLGDYTTVQDIDKKNFMELYFESTEIKAIDIKLKLFNCEYVHPVREQPWGQRVLRFYDPDGYIIEVGEPMDSVIRRFAVQGLSREEISQRSSMPLEFVDMVLDQRKQL